MATQFEPGPTSDQHSQSEFEGYNQEVDNFRDTEYPALGGKVYLDHAGATLYANSLVDDFCHDLKSNLYGNPHSASAPAELAGRRVDETREKTLRFFNADPEHFDLVFVANASAAIKLVNECFRDYVDPNCRAQGRERRHLWYGYHRDAHNSLVGIRESAHDCNTCFRNDHEVEDWIEGRVAFHAKPQASKGKRVSLFAYPGQSNLNGRRLPLDWPGRIRRSPHTAGTYTFLDAAALATTAPLDFSDESNAPDFTCLSFYKIFGFPNIGALIIRKAAGHVLTERKFFGGGTVDMVICLDSSWHAKKKKTLHDHLEDGTLPFHSIFALDAAINVHQRLFGSMRQISAHTAFLAKRLYDGMVELRHWNGMPLCRIYKEDSSVYGDPKTQGATIAFNVQHSDGMVVSPLVVEQEANKRDIYLRSGSMCNPGGAAAYLGWSARELHTLYERGHRCGTPAEIIRGKPIGVVRASLGAMSTTSDVDTFLNVLADCYTDRFEDALTRITITLNHSSGKSIGRISIGSQGARSPLDVQTDVPRVKRLLENVNHKLSTTADTIREGVVTHFTVEPSWGNHLVADADSLEHSPVDGPEEQLHIMEPRSEPPGELPQALPKKERRLHQKFSSLGNRLSLLKPQAKHSEPTAKAGAEVRPHTSQEHVKKRHSFYRMDSLGSAKRFPSPSEHLLSHPGAEKDTPGKMPSGPNGSWLLDPGQVS